MRPFWLPISFGLMLSAMAPVARVVTNWMLEVLGTRFAVVLAGVLGVAGVTVAVWAWRRIATDRVTRYAAVASGLLMVVLPILASHRGTLTEAAVERMHFLFYGTLALLFYRAFDRSRHGLATPLLTVLAVAVAGVLDELVQWALALRTGDLFDVLLNGYAGLCGVVVAFGLLGLEDRRRPGQREHRRLAALGFFLVRGAGVFCDLSHLGFEIEDPEFGRFRSFYPTSRLVATDGERSERWRRSPPNRPFGLLELEDYFQTEAGWHTQRRNLAFHGGDFSTAWAENRILEKYSSSFLALDGAYPEGPFRFVLPSAELQRLAVAAPRGGTGARFQSTAEHGRIWVRPRPRQWWSITGMLLAVLGFGAVRGRFIRDPAQDPSR